MFSSSGTFIDMLCVFINAGVRAGTPDDMDDIFDPAINPPDAFEAPPSPSLPPAQGRQKMAAAVKPFDASHFLSRLQSHSGHSVESGHSVDTICMDACLR